MFGSTFDAYNPATGQTEPQPTSAPEPEPAPAPEPEPVAVEQQPLPPPPAAPASSASAGVSLVLAGIGAAVGWAAGGLWGAGAGALWVGAARNGLRSKAQWQTDPSGAAKTASLAVVGAALGGYLAYRAYQARSGPKALE